MRFLIPNTDVGNAFIGFSAERLRMMGTKGAKGTEDFSLLTFAAQLPAIWVQAETFTREDLFLGISTTVMGGFYCVSPIGIRNRCKLECATGCLFLLSQSIIIKAFLWSPFCHLHLSLLMEDLFASQEAFSLRSMLSSNNSLALDAPESRQSLAHLTLLPHNQYLIS